LAYCFYRQGKHPEAHEWAQQALAQKEGAHARELLGLIEMALNAG
jgi:hypothetical protein